MNPSFCCKGDFPDPTTHTLRSITPPGFLLLEAFWNGKTGSVRGESSRNKLGELFCLVCEHFAAQR